MEDAEHGDLCVTVQTAVTNACSLHRAVRQRPHATLHLLFENILFLVSFFIMQLTGLAYLKPSGHF